MIRLLYNFKDYRNLLFGVMFLHYLSNGGTRGQRNSLINYNGYYYTKFSRLIKNIINF